MFFCPSSEEIWAVEGRNGKCDHLTSSSMIFSQKSCEWGLCIWCSLWLWWHLLPQPSSLGSQFPSWNSFPVPNPRARGSHTQPQSPGFIPSSGWFQRGRGGNSQLLFTKDTVEPACDGAYLLAKQHCSRSGNLCQW